MTKRFFPFTQYPCCEFTLSPESPYADVPLIKIIPGQTEVRGTVVDKEEWKGTYGINATLILDQPDGKRVKVTEKAEKVREQFQKAGYTEDQIVGLTVKIVKKPMNTDPTKGFFNLYVDRNAMAGRLSAPPAPKTPPKPAPKDDSIPDWLAENAGVPTDKERFIKEQARSDALWGWQTAQAVMKGAYAQDPNTGEIDPGALPAVQAMAVGLMIRLEHARRN